MILVVPLLLSVLTLDGGHLGHSRQVAASPEAPIFALRRGPDGVTLERLLVREGVPLELPCGTEEGWLELILPPGPGGSASILNGGSKGVLRAALEDGRLRVEHVGADGQVWQGPSLGLDELRGLRVRVCVTAADGSGAAFVITEWDRGCPDPVGPVVNLFGGRIPLGEGDYALSTDTLRLWTGPQTLGSCPLELDNHLFVRGSIPGGGEGWFLLDTGGAVTVVTRSVLPPEHPVREARAVQYSSAGKEFVKYSPRGATGAVDTVLGLTTLELTFGDLTFEDAEVTVLSDLPDLFGRPVVGILGLDLLRRAPLCRIGFGEEGPQLALLAARDQEAPADTIPFTYVRDHLVVPVEIEGVAITAIVDTGSAALFLDEQAARAAELVAVEGEDREARGMDEGGVATMHVSAGEPRVRLGGTVLVGPKTVFGSLPVFAGLRQGGQLVGLLGNSVLSRFSAVEIDFRVDRILLRR